MTIEIPDEVKWLVPIVVGTDWPEGDEDALRRMSEAWSTCAGEVESALGDTEAAVKAALSTMEGQTAQAFEQFGQGLTSGDEAPLVKLNELCDALGEACDNTAMEVEYTKLSIIASLIILAAQIAAMIASAAATFGASTAGVPVAQAATQMTVRMFFQQLLQKIATSVATNLAMNVGVDALIQGGQMLEGNRDSWDGDKTVAAAKTGVAAGLAGGLVEGAAGGLAARGFGNSTSSFTGAAAYGAGQGALSGSLGNVFNDVAQGNDLSWQSARAGAINGAVGGALGGMQDRHTGLDQTWNHDGVGPDYVSGANNQGWRFQTDEGSVVGANVDSPYSNSWNSDTAQQLPDQGGPNGVNVDQDKFDTAPSAPAQGSEQSELDLPEGPNG